MCIRDRIKAFPCHIECVQTDNGQEFTKRFSPYGGSDNPTLFQERLAEHGIRHKLIRPFTPRHNGKVERSHRKDNEQMCIRDRVYPHLYISVLLQVHISPFSES